MTASALLEEAAPPTDSFARLLERLSTMSVRRRWEAYRDVAWDDPAFAVDADDPRWEAPTLEPLGSSEWYRSSAPERRSAMGLQRTAAFLKVGIEFETILQSGIVTFASTLPNRHPVFRYAYHEISEEAQHSMMFQELINRSGCDPAPSPERVQQAFDRLAELGRSFPALFFLAVLGGEEAFDAVQRMGLTWPATHPLLARINRIHCTEESRHLSFGRALLADMIPQLSDHELRRLRYQAPLVVDWTARRMFELPASLVERWGMPEDVAHEIADGPAAVRNRRASMARLVDFCRRVGIITPRLEPTWVSLGLA